MSAELAVPDEARRRYDEVMIDLQLVAKGVRAPSRTQYGNILAIAKPVVVAELRRLAASADDEGMNLDREGFDVAGESRFGLASWLRERADQLDPQ